MWGDVQKKLHQYIDDPALFQRMEARLKNSNELILLRLENRKIAGEVDLGRGWARSRARDYYDLWRI